MVVVRRPPGRQAGRCPTNDGQGKCAAPCEASNVTAAPTSSASPEHTKSEGDLRQLLEGRGSGIALLSAGAVVGGLLEAAFLVIVTRSAFAITDGNDRFGIIAGIEVSVTSAIVIALALVLARVGMAVATAWQSARLSSSVIAG
jgi:hypothetical protein